MRRDKVKSGTPMHLKNVDDDDDMPLLYLIRLPYLIRCMGGEYKVHRKRRKLGNCP